MDWTAATALIAALTGLIAALTPLLIELRKWWWRVPPGSENKS